MAHTSRIRRRKNTSVSRLISFYIDSSLMCLHLNNVCAGEPDDSLLGPAGLKTTPRDLATEALVAVSGWREGGQESA